MMNISENNRFFKALCKFAKIGELTANPERLSGGLLHEMYKVETSQGWYAVKILNPKIMQRKDALHNFIHSEEIANLASKQIPALPAMRLNGGSVQRSDEQYYLIFDWVEGTSLKQNEIRISHSREVGRMLGKIHHLNLAKHLASQNVHLETVSLLDWEGYLTIGTEKSADWVPTLGHLKDKLIELNEAAFQASSTLSSSRVISHRDLDSKNILWDSNGPIIIDWESAGYIHPMLDLVETLLYWSQDEQGNVDKAKFNAFLDGYEEVYPQLRVDWQAVLSLSFWSKLKWLEYNLKRSIGIDSIDNNDQLAGREQVRTTLNELDRDATQIPRLNSWLNEHMNVNKGVDGIS